MVPHLISSPQRIPWISLAIWLIWPPLLSHQITVFTKANQPHFSTSPPAISPDSNLSCTPKPANGKRDQPTSPSMETTLGLLELTAELYIHGLSRSNFFYCTFVRTAQEFSLGWQQLHPAAKGAAVEGLGSKGHPQQNEIFFVWCRSAEPGVTVSAKTPLWYCRTRLSCKKLKRKQQEIEWMKKSLETHEERKE